MGGEEGSGKLTGRKSAEARASKGPSYTGGPRTPRRGYAATLGCEADGSTVEEAGPESGLKFMRRAAFIEITIFSSCYTAVATALSPSS